MDRVSFSMEFLFKASPTILYQFLTTPSCLIRWFCDEVDISGDQYEFSWNGASEFADLIEDVEEELLRFHWEDAADDNEFLEFRIATSPVTGETILTITDFCDSDEIDDQKQLWQNQMNILARETGG